MIKTRAIHYYIFIHFIRSTFRCIITLGVFLLFEQKQSVTNGRQFRNTEGKTDGERLINAYWDWGNEKTTLITVRLAWTASEWTHEFILISQNYIEWLGSEGTCGYHQEQPPAKAGSPRADCTGLCPGELWLSLEKDTPQHLGQPIPMLSHPQTKEVFLHLQMWELPVFHFSPVALHPVTGHLWKETSPILWVPIFKIFKCIDKIPAYSSLLQHK